MVGCKKKLSHIDAEDGRKDRNMIRKIDEDTRFGVGAYRYTSDTIHSQDDAIRWLCRAREIGGLSVEYIRLEDIDGNENDTTTRLPADATPEKISEELVGKEIGRVALVGSFMGESCRISVYLKGYTIHLFLNTLDPVVRDCMVKAFETL